MWRVLAIVEEMGQSLNSAASLLSKALKALDAEMSQLQDRLAADAIELERAVAACELPEPERENLMAALLRVEETAMAVAAFAHRKQHEGDGEEPKGAT